MNLSKTPSLIAMAGALLFAGCTIDEGTDEPEATSDAEALGGLFLFHPLERAQQSGRRRRRAGG